eukprot:ctg_1327.g434
MAQPEESHSESHRILQRHEEERQALQSKFEALLRNIPRRNKVERRLVERDWRMEQDQLQRRQAAEAEQAGVPLQAVDAMNSERDPAPGFYVQRELSKKQRKKLARASAQADADRRAAEERQLAAPSERDEESRRIEAVLARYALRVAEVRPDGHCLFRAVAHQLHTSCPEGMADGLRVSDPQVADRLREWPDDVDADERVWILRDVAADYMRQHRDDFMPFVAYDEHGIEVDASEERAFETYCARMSSTAAWGTQLEIQALARALGVPVEVYGDPAVLTGGVLRMGEEPVVAAVDDSSRPRPVLRLSYHRRYYELGEHFNSVVPMESDVEPAAHDDANAVDVLTRTLPQERRMESATARECVNKTQHT